MALVVDVYIDKGNLIISGELPVSCGLDELEAFIAEIRLKLLGDREQAPTPQSIVKHELTEGEAAKYIGKSKSFLRRCRRDGRVNGCQRGPCYTRDTERTIRYPIGELDKWLASRELYQVSCEEHDYAKDRR